MPKKILIIRMSALGDIIHGLPVAAAIKSAIPRVEIGWLVEARGAGLLRDNPAIDRLHILRRGKPGEGPGGSRFTALIGEIRREKYDAAIDLQGLTKSAVWARLSGAGERIGFDGDNAQEISRLFYNRAIRPAQHVKHIVHQNLALLRALGIENPGVEFPLTLDPVSRESGERLWGNRSGEGPRIVLNVGGGWPTKLWPAENFGKLSARLVSEMKAHVAIAWGPGEEVAARNALEISGAKSGTESSPIDSERSVFLLPKTSFLELGGCIGAANLYVGGDTGPSHLASALGVPCVALFGPSDGERNGPLIAASSAKKMAAPDSATRVIQLGEPECIPCWKTKCAWDEPLACMKGIGVDRVFEACAELLGR